MFGHCLCHIFAFNSCDHCANLMLYISPSVLLRVLKLLAASMLLMKMPPLPILGGMMHSMSYSQVPSLRLILKCLSSIYRIAKGASGARLTFLL